MPFFSRPLWLLAFPLLMYALWRIQQKTFADAGPARRTVWLAIRAIVLLLTVLALAGLHWERGLHQRELLLLVDISGSITAEQRQSEIAAVNKIVKRTAKDDRVGMILFGGNPSVERFPAAPFPIENFESQIDLNATNIESAARLAGALFTSSSQKSLVLLSDGQDNEGTPEQELRLLKDRGVSIQALYFPSPPHTEARIEKIRLPDEVKLREPFDIEVIAEANQRMLALLQILRNGTLIQEATILLIPSEKQVFRFPQKIEQAGIYRYEVQLKPQRDFRNENNFQEGWVSVEGAPRILLVDTEPERLNEFRQMLASRGFQSDIRTPQSLPNTMESLLDYQTIILRNVPASVIHSQMPLLRDYVYNFGGGFAMLGAENSFGPGGYFKTPVEAILPVRMDLTNKKYLADIAMVIVIDKSGSMSYADRGRQKIDLADEGAARVAAFLKNTDQLGVLAVDSVPKWVYGIQKLGDYQRAVDSITSIRAGGGGIYVYSGLREAYDRLRSTRAPVKHVILFADTADCEEKDGPSGQSALALAQSALREDRITTTAIGIGQTGDPDVEFLSQLAGLGKGRFYFTSDMFTLPEIFAQESTIVQRYYITEETFTPRLVQQEPLLTGIDATPDLHGYVATSAKPLATVNLVSHHHDPILACWQYGLGRTVAFTSDPAGKWTSGWSNWKEAQRLWSQIGHYLTQDAGLAHFRTTLSQENGETTIILEALDNDGQYVNSARFAGAFLDSAGEDHRLDFQQTGPGHYQAAFKSSSSAIGKIVRLENGRIAEQALVQIPAGSSKEFLNSRNGKARLQELTGAVLDSPEKVLFGKGSSEELLPLQNQLLLLAALLFIFDVAARKIDIKRLLSRETVKNTDSQSRSLVLRPLMERKKTAERFRKTDNEEIPDLPPATPVPPMDPPDANGNYMGRLKEAKKRKGSREI